MTTEVITCETTGIAVLQANQQISYRLAKPSYGVLNPPRRPITSADDQSKWNRFDLPAEQTIYAASTPEGAYGELLGALKKPHKNYRTENYLDNAGTGDLYEQIASDWAEMGKRPPFVVNIAWLYSHSLYTLAMPTRGWFVEIENSRTITFLEQHIPVDLWERGVTDITVAEIRSSDRGLTIALARILSTTTLVNGEEPLGVHYYSKHGTDWTCWAVWLRDNLADDISINLGVEVLPPSCNPPLAKVLDTYNLTT